MQQLADAAGQPVSRETFMSIQNYCDALKAESVRQNLVSASTLDNLWDRHIIDSAQLARFLPNKNASWVDVGSGAGLPGVVLSALLPGAITMVEPRTLRSDFLRRVVADLHLDATVLGMKAERVAGRFDVITARAVAALDRLLAMTSHLSHAHTLWVLPKGRNANSELEQACGSWHYDVRAEPSITDPESAILLLSNVRAKSKR